MNDLDRDKKISKEISRLKKLYKNIPKEKTNAVLALIKNAAFMTITLEDLQEAINKNGPISEYKNGANQFGTKQSPEVAIYNTMIKNLAAIIKQLTDLLPPGEKQKVKEDDPFVKILSRGKSA